MADQKPKNKWFDSAVDSVADFFAPRVAEQPKAPTAPTAPNAQAQQPASAPAQPAPIRTASSIAQGKGGVSNPGIRAQLLQTIAENNIDGLDFYEFNKALDNDKSIREQDKYTKVYSFMLSMSQEGHDLKKTLLDSGKVYLGVLDEEKAAMEAEFKNLEDTRVGSKRAALEQATHDIGELERQKAEIEQQLQDRRVKAAELQDQVDSDNIALQRQRNDFNATFDELYGEFKTKLDNSEQYITSQ